MEYSNHQQEVFLNQPDKRQNRYLLKAHKYCNGLHLFFEQFDLNYLIPRIIGRSVHLPPLVVILGIVSGALLAGVLGIPLAAPTIASARVIGRYIFANLFDMEWKPISATQPLPPPKTYWWQHSQRRGKLP